MSKLVLVTAQPRTPSTGATTTVRMAGGGNAKPYYIGGNHYRAGIAALSRFSAAIEFDETGWTGGVVPTTGQIAWSPSSKADLAAMAAYYWPGAAITLQQDDEDAATPATRLTGKVADAAVQNHSLVMTLADLAVGLDRPVVTAHFAGSGGVEGGTEAKNRVKRRSWGRCFNIEGRILDKANNVYEFGDLNFPWQQFDDLKDIGRSASPAPTVLSWQGSVSATLTALAASTPAAGSGVVAPSIACAKWWTQPVGPLTADIRGEVGSGYVETCPEIAERILGALSGPTITNTAAMATARAGPAGIHIDEGENINSALNRLLLGVSVFWKLNADLGTITLYEFTFSSPAASLISDNVNRLRTMKPIKTRRLGYQRAYRIHSDGEIASSLLPQLVVPAGVEIQADTANTTTTLLPMDVRARAVSGGVDQSPNTDFSLTVTTGISATINNTPGSADRGVITITADTAAGSMTVTATIPGYDPIVRTITVSRTQAPPTVSGGSGATSATTTNFITFSTTTFVAITDIITVRSTSGGTVRYSGSYEHWDSDNTEAKIQYSVAGANSWNDIASATGGYPYSFSGDPFYGDFQAWPGGCYIAEATKSGLTASTDYDFRMVARRQAGSGDVSLGNGHMQVRQ